MSRFFDPKLAGLAPYTPGEQPQNRKYIKLNTNESPYPPAPGVQKAVAGEAPLLQLYPDLEALPLRRALAARLGAGPENLLLGNGSDELLAFLFQAFCPKGAAFADLTYGFYPVYCALYGVSPQIIPLREDFTLCPADYYGLGKTVFIANPNAPTGLALAGAQIEEILKANPGALVVVDEAYVDFGAESAAPLVHRYDNVAVVGTFSKSRSMAGARLGYALASPAVIADLNRVKFSFNPYNVNRMTLAAGLAALEAEAYYEGCWQKIIATRRRALGELRRLGFACTDSLSNFLFVRHTDRPAEQLYLALREKGILVRWFNKPRITDYLRITVGSDEEMDILLREIRTLL